MTRWRRCAATLSNPNPDPDPNPNPNPNPNPDPNSNPNPNPNSHQVRRVLAAVLHLGNLRFTAVQLAQQASCATRLLLLATCYSLLTTHDARRTTHYSLLRPALPRHTPWLYLLWQDDGSAADAASAPRLTSAASLLGLDSGALAAALTVKSVGKFPVVQVPQPLPRTLTPDPNP